MGDAEFGRRVGIWLHRGADELPDEVRQRLEQIRRQAMFRKGSLNDSPSAGLPGCARTFPLHPALADMPNGPPGALD